MKRLIKEEFALSGVGLLNNDDDEVIVMGFKTRADDDYILALRLRDDKISYSKLIEGEMKDKASVLTTILTSSFNDDGDITEYVLLTTIVQMFVEHSETAVSTTLKKASTKLRAHIAATITEAAHQTDVDDLLNEIGIN